MPSTSSKPFSPGHPPGHRQRTTRRRPILPHRPPRNPGRRKRKSDESERRNARPTSAANRPRGSGNGKRSFSACRRKPPASVPNSKRKLLAYRHGSPRKKSARNKRRSRETGDMALHIYGRTRKPCLLCGRKLSLVSVSHGPPREQKPGRANTFISVGNARNVAAAKSRLPAMLWPVFKSRRPFPPRRAAVRPPCSPPCNPAGSPPAPVGTACTAFPASSAHPALAPTAAPIIRSIRRRRSPVYSPDG